MWQKQTIVTSGRTPLFNRSSTGTIKLHVWRRHDKLMDSTYFSRAGGMVHHRSDTMRQEPFGLELIAIDEWHRLLLSNIQQISCNWDYLKLMTSSMKMMCQQFSQDNFILVWHSWLEHKSKVLKLPEYYQQIYHVNHEPVHGIHSINKFLDILFTSFRILLCYTILPP